MSQHPPVVIVCGLRQSQVGQLAAALANTPQTLLLPELNLFMASSVGALQLLFSRSHDGLGDGLLRAIACYKFGRDNLAAIEQAQDWLWRRSDWSGADLLHHLADTLAPRQLILPDRMLGWRPQYLRRLQEFDKFQLLHLSRHPIEHGTDLADQLRREAFVAPEWRDFYCEPDGALDPQIGWYRFHHSLLQRFANDARYVPLRLEDLLRAPAAVIGRLAGQLAWAQPPRLDTRPDSPFLQVGCEAAPMGLEKDVLLDAGLRLEIRAPQARLNAALPWRPDVPGLSREVRQLASTLGYA